MTARPIGSRPSAEGTSGAARAALALALLVPAVLLVARGADATPFGALLALVILFGLRTGERLTAGAAVQVALALLAGGATVGLLLGVGEESGPGFGRSLCAALLAVAAARLWLRVGGAGRAVTLGLGLVALMGLARATARWEFGVGVAAYLALGVVAHLRADPAWAPFGRHRRHLLLPLAGGLGLAGTVMAGLAWSLPAAEPAVARALRPFLQGTEEAARSGYGHGQLELGQIASILTSDEVALRVEGEGVERLRGRVFVDYRGGSWHARTVKRAPVDAVMDDRLVLGRGAPRGEVIIESEAAIGRHLFTPLSALEVRGAPRDISVDVYGVITVHADQARERHRYRVTVAADGDGRRLYPPDEADLLVPLAGADRDALLRRVRAWTAGAADDAARVEALRQALAGRHAYTLRPGRVPAGRDPVVHFLTETRAGHCEYFASALTLMARLAGVPARLVTGFRVFEYNAVGGYYVVRQRDAHAWVEVFTDGAWRTVDPTPAAPLTHGRAARTPGFAARWDLIRRGFFRAWDRLASLSPLELLAGLTGAAALALLWLLVRRRRGGGAGRPVAETFGPLAALETHLAATRRIRRPPHRPLGAFADDLRRAELDEAATLVDACDRLLYGGRGDPAALEQAVRRYVGR